MAHWYSQSRTPERRCQMDVTNQSNLWDGCHNPRDDATIQSISQRRCQPLGWMPQSNQSPQRRCQPLGWRPQSNQSPNEDANLLDGCHNPINLPMKMPTWMDATIPISQKKIQLLGWHKEEDANQRRCQPLQCHNLLKEDANHNPISSKKMPTTIQSPQRRCQPQSNLLKEDVPQSPQRRCQPQFNLLKEDANLSSATINLLNEDANHNPISSVEEDAGAQLISSKKMPPTINPISSKKMQPLQFHNLLQEDAKSNLHKEDASQAEMICQPRSATIQYSPRWCLGATIQSSPRWCLWRCQPSSQSPECRDMPPIHALSTI